MSAKQDRVYTRTPAQLEQKLDLGKRFAEVMGIATGARDAAEEAKEATKNLDSDLTSEEIFNRLTENGTLQGLYRDKEGNLYINAEFIQAVEKLFAKDIEMTGTFTQTGSAFVEPTEYEWKCLIKHLWGGNVPTDSGDDYTNVEDIPDNYLWAYDFDEDGALTENDANILYEIVQGNRSIEEFRFAEVSEVTVTLKPSDASQVIKLSGLNMWGHSFTKYIGVNKTNIKNPETERKLNVLSNGYMVDYGEIEDWKYQKWNNGFAECWAEIAFTPDTNIQSGGEVRCTVNLPFTFATTPIAFVHVGALAYKFRKAYPLATTVNNLTLYGKLEADLGLTTSETVSFMVQVKGYWK